LGPAGIRVCTVVPGVFATPLSAAVPAELNDRLVGITPFPKRLGEPAEFAGLVRHLAENQMMNGAIVRIMAASG
jgi:NAD(P)-dependent dehydrogenase (short-subunit alcohol dehydrogenase family)